MTSHTLAEEFFKIILKTKSGLFETYTKKYISVANPKLEMDPSGEIPLLAFSS